MTIHDEKHADMTRRVAVGIKQADVNMWYRCLTSSCDSRTGCEHMKVEELFELLKNRSSWMDNY